MPSNLSSYCVRAVILAVACFVAVPKAQAPRQPFSRVAVTVTPDHPDWTYRLGEAVTFRVDVVRDGHRLRVPP